MENQPLGSPQQLQKLPNATAVLVLVVMLLSVFSFVSCNKEKELTKMIPADRVELIGDNSDLFEIEDSVKVMLVPVGTDGKRWEVRTLLPLKNTMPWSEIPGSDQSLDHFISGVSIYPTYLDRNNSNVDISIETDNSEMGMLLKSNEIVTRVIAINEYSYGNKSYKRQKAYFDLIDGVKITIKLGWAHKVSPNTSSTPSLSSSNTDISKLLDEYEKYVNECVDLIIRQDRGENVPESKIDNLLGKIEELENELDKQIDKMSDAQYKRYEKLDDKIWNAI